MRYFALIFLTSCAGSTTKLEARVHDLELRVAELRAAPAAGMCIVTHDVSVPPETMFDAVVPFRVGETSLRDGDRIVVDEVRGTSAALAVNGLYVVRGRYTLASADEASPSFTVRATHRSDGCTSGGAGGAIHVKRGSGTFELARRIAYRGDPSISFFRVHDGVATNRDEIGSVTFGHVGADPVATASRAFERARAE